MLANAAQSESICALYLWRLQAIWILSELFVNDHLLESPHNLMLIDNILPKKGLSWCCVVEFYVLHNNV